MTRTPAPGPAPLSDAEREQAASRIRDADERGMLTLAEAAERQAAQPLARHRAHRPAPERRGSVGSVVGGDEDRGDASVTGLHPHRVGSDLGARFAIGQRVPRCQWRYWPHDEQDGVGVFWLLDVESRSWAKLSHHTPDAGAPPNSSR